MSSSKSLIENYSNQVWNSKGVDVVDQLFTDESVIHSPLETLHGKDSMGKIIEAWLNAFPDLVVEHEAFVEEGDTVVSRWKAKGTHKGPFKGIEATGLPVAYEGVSIYRLSNEKVVDYWAFVNLHHIIEQLTTKAPAMKG